MDPSIWRRTLIPENKFWRIELQVIPPPSDPDDFDRALVQIVVDHEADALAATRDVEQLGAARGYRPQPATVADPAQIHWNVTLQKTLR